MQTFITSRDGLAKSIETRQGRRHARRLPYYKAMVAVCVEDAGQPSCFSSLPSLGSRVVFLHVFITALFASFTGPSLLVTKFCRTFSLLFVAFLRAL